MHHSLVRGLIIAITLAVSLQSAFADGPARTTLGPRRVLGGHAFAVTDAAYSPDGTLAATTSWDKNIHLYDFLRGTRLGVFSGHTGAVAGVLFTPDGKTLISGSMDKTVKFWDVATRKEIGQIPAQSPVPLYAIALSPDGNLLATGTGAYPSAQGAVRLFDMKNKKLLATLKHAGTPWALDFSPDGKWLAAGDSVGDVRIWDAEKHTQVKSLPRARTLVAAVAFSPKGDYFAYGSGPGMVVLWSTKNWEIEGVRHMHKNAVNGIAFSPDGHALVSTSDDGLINFASVREFEDRTPITVNPNFGKLRFANISPDGKTMLTGGEDSHCRIWDVADVIAEISKPTPPTRLVLKGQKSVRVALVGTQPSERIDNLIDLTSARLSDSEGVELLERKSVRKLLEEHKLSLSGLVNADSAIRAGKLLKVDLFGLIESAADSNEGMGLVVYDAGTGIKLVDESLPTGGLERHAGLVAEGVRQAAEKRSADVKDLRTLCILSTRNADLPRHLDHLAQSVGMLLERQLVHSPSVGLLERKRLDLVTKEKSLPTEENGRDLLSALVLVDIEIARADNGIRAAAYLTNPQRQPIDTIKVEVREPNVQAIVAALQDGITKALRTTPPRAVLNPERESRRFQREAHRLMTQNDFRAATEAMAAAAALKGDHESHAQLAYYTGNYAASLIHPQKAVSTSLLRVPAEQLKLAFQQGMNALEIRLQAAQSLHGKPFADHQIFWKCYVDRVTPPHALYENLRVIDAKSFDDEALRLREEFLDLSRRTIAAEVDAWYRLVKSGDGNFTGFTYYMTTCIENAQRTMPSEEQNLQMRLDIMKKWAEVAGLRDHRFEPRFIDGFMQTVFILHGHYRDFYASLESHPVPLIALTGRKQKLMLDVNKKLTADQAQGEYQKLLRDGLQILQDYRPEPATAVNLDLRPAYYEFLFRTMGYWRFVAKSLDVDQWFQERFALCNQMLKRKELVDVVLLRTIEHEESAKNPYWEQRWQLLEQAFALLDRPKECQLCTNPEALKFKLEEARRKILAANPDLAVRWGDRYSTAPWDQEQTLLDFAKYPGIKQTLPPLVVGTNAYVVAGLVIDNQCWAHVLHVNLKDQQVQGLGKVIVNAKPSTSELAGQSPQLTACCLGADRIFVGSRHGGIHFFDFKGNAGPLAANDELPSQEVEALAWLNGKLYAALKGGFLLAFDAEGKSFEVLASSRRRDRLSPFDDGEAFRIRYVVADPARNRLLFVLYQRPNHPVLNPEAIIAKDTTNGIWEYNAKTKTFTRHVELFWDTIAWGTPIRNGHILFDGTDHSSTGVLDFDIQANQAKLVWARKNLGPTLPLSEAPSKELYYPRGVAELVRDGWLWSAFPLARVSLSQKKQEWFGTPEDERRGILSPGYSLEPIGERELLLSDAMGVRLLRLKSPVTGK